MPRMTVGKRKPQDLTLRNARAALRRIENLKHRVRRLELAMRQWRRLLKRRG